MSESNASTAGADAMSSAEPGTNPGRIQGANDRALIQSLERSLAAALAQIEALRRPVVEWSNFPIVPMGKVRQNRSDAWKQRPVVLRWRAFADRCRELGITLEPGDEMQFRIAMPASWSKKKRADHVGKPHLAKPDLDNMVGAVMDAVMPKGDSHLWKLGETSKMWAESASISVGRPPRRP